MKRHLRAIYGIWALLVLLGGLWVRRVVLPPRPGDADTPHPRKLPRGEGTPLPTGKGLRLLVNPGAGPAFTPAPTDQLREALPDADIVELDDDCNISELLSDPDLVAIGASGGDGTLGAVAAIAVDTDTLFVPVPGGTLNHFARDMGLGSVEDAIQAVHDGCAASIDVGVVGDRVFLNTFSFGGYTNVVDRREKWERRLGKWPALLVAMLVELPRMEPLRLEIDGRLQRVWLAWVGNCTYSPDGLGPRWREQMDDGLLDVRLVNGTRRFSRLRFAAAVVTGRLRHCSVYEAWTASRLEVVSFGGPVRLAADGETFDGTSHFVVAKKNRALRVALPHPDSTPDQ